VYNRAQSPIFVKTHDLLVWLLERTAQFPKNERFRMARRVEDSAFALHDLLMRAVRARDPARVLWQADLELDRLRFSVRICQELKLISFAQYEYAAERLVEVGKLLGAWIKKERAGLDAREERVGKEHPPLPPDLQSGGPAAGLQIQPEQ